MESRLLLLICSILSLVGKIELGGGGGGGLCSGITFFVVVV